MTKKFLYAQLLKEILLPEARDRKDNALNFAASAWSEISHVPSSTRSNFMPLPEWQ
jgi:hypothetical protein